MGAAELLQLSIVKGLRAKTGAIEAEPPELAQFFNRQFTALASGLRCIPLRSLADLCVSAVSVFS